MRATRAMAVYIPTSSVQMFFAWETYSKLLVKSWSTATLTGEVTNEVKELNDYTTAALTGEVTNEVKKLND